jgi:hypothetical protein
MKTCGGFKILRAVVKKISSFGYITPSSACYLLNAGVLSDSFFDPEDGGDMFLRNFG